ncbi:MAG: hypothetical protein K6C30_00975 [Bacteroidaceae bacterium]|nr:hypothetical protein [Bacteroidaceae bacterium]
MIQINVSQEIRQRCPYFVGAAVLAPVHNSASSAALWQEIDRSIADYRARYTPDSIKEMPAIQATREAYRRCGKDPSRYRPSGEALVRRTLQGHDLYRVSTLVDLINLASINFGYSIGGFDADKIQGTSAPAAQDEPADDSRVLTLGIGREGEPYEGIGRGPLNIAGLPVYRDAIGGIGTPTSDHERTKLTLQTTHLLTIVNGYDGNRENTLSCATFLQDLLRRYADSDGGQLLLF